MSILWKTIKIWSRPSSASNLDWNLEIDNESRKKIKLYDNWDDFSSKLSTFHFYVATFQQRLHTDYLILLSQLIRYSRACIFYHYFLDRWLLLSRKLLKQEFQMVKLKSFLRKFYRRHHEFVDRYGITVSQMISEMFLMLWLQYPVLFTNMTYRIRLFTLFDIT